MESSSNLFLPSFRCRPPKVFLIPTSTSMGTFVPFAHFLGEHLDRPLGAKNDSSDFDRASHWRRRTFCFGHLMGGGFRRSRSLIGPYIGPVVVRNGTWVGSCFPVGKFGRLDNDIQNRHGTLFHRDGDVFVGHRGLPCGAAPNKMGRGSYG